MTFFDTTTDDSPSQSANETNAEAPATATGKAKKKGGQRRARGVSRITRFKQKFIIEGFRNNREASLNSLMRGVEEHFGSKISFPRAKEAQAAFEKNTVSALLGDLEDVPIPARFGKGTPGPKRGRGRIMGGRGRSMSGSDFIVSTRDEKNRITYETFTSKSDLDRRISQLMNDGVPIARIGIYTRVEPQISVNI